MKLSKAQTKILRRMAGGDRYIYLHGRTSHGFWSNSPGDYSHRVDMRSIFKLRRLGFVKDIQEEAWRWRDNTYVITDAGRERVESLRAITLEDRQDETDEPGMASVNYGQR